MPSFDVVSKVDKHELTNAVDQAKRELEKRYDLRGTNARFELEEYVITQFAPSEYQLDQLLDMLKPRLAGRGIDLKAIDLGEIETNPTWRNRGARSPSSRASSRFRPRRSWPS